MRRYTPQVTFFAFDMSSSSWILIMNSYVLVKSSIIFAKSIFWAMFSSYYLVPYMIWSAVMFPWRNAFLDCVLMQLHGRKKIITNFRFLFFHPNFHEILLIREGSFLFKFIVQLHISLKKIIFPQMLSNFFANFCELTFFSAKCWVSLMGFIFF